ncbi:hypothetical protein, partial [Brevibacterium metallidurans]
IRTPLTEKSRTRTMNAERIPWKRVLGPELRWGFAENMGEKNAILFLFRDEARGAEGSRRAGGWVGIGDM